MTPIVFGSLEAQVILKKDRILRAEAVKEARIEKAKCEGRTLKYEVFIEEDPPPERSVIVEAYSEEEARVIAEKEHVGYNETVSGVELV